MLTTFQKRLRGSQTLPVAGPGHGPELGLVLQLGSRCGLGCVVGEVGPGAGGRGAGCPFITVLPCRDVVQETTTMLRNAAGNFYINDKSTGSVVGQQPFGGARASGEWVPLSRGEASSWQETSIASPQGCSE